MGWANIPQKEEDYLDIDTSIPEPPVYREPDTKTVLVDLATEAENKKTHVPEEKVFEKRKEEGFSMAPPVEIYEPGFRSDMYDAILNYFKEKKKVRDKNQEIRKKFGWR